MEWWQILLDILPVLVTGGFSIWLYKLNKQDKEMSDKMAAQQKLVDNYRKELDEYKRNKQFYKKWIFEKKFELMKEITALLFYNVNNATVFLQEYGRKQVDFKNIDWEAFNRNRNQLIENLDSFIKIAYSAQFFVEKDISSAFADFTKDNS